MSNTMLARVTNAIGTTFLNGGSYEDLARAAIQAMREPTPEMIQAGYDAPMRTYGTVYEAMIDAALGKATTDKALDQ